jgi:Helix-turn-helix domain
MIDETTARAGPRTPLTGRGPGLEDRVHLTTNDAAAYLGLSPRTLEKHRCYGTGPVYRKLGGRVVYQVSQLEAWAELGTRRSTSDPGKGRTLPAKRHSAPGAIGRHRQTT